MNKISVFGGTGFIGGTFHRLYSEDVVLVSRESKEFETNEVLYFISTTTNQSVFSNLHIDIDTNLSLFVDVLEKCKGRDVTFNFISSGFVYGNDIIDVIRLVSIQLSKDVPNNYSFLFVKLLESNTES